MPEMRSAAGSRELPAQGAASAVTGTLLFATSLEGFSFSEGETEIEVCRDGTWRHEKYGQVTVTPEMRERLAANFRDNVRRVGDLPLDFDHQPSPAPGWIRGLVNRGRSLFAKVSLTPVGRESIRKGEYRFFSPEWHPAWKDPESGTEHGPTLFGGAFTNKPFFRGMAALQCSEEAEGPVEIRAEELLSLESGAYGAVEPGGLTAAETLRMQEELRTLRAREERRELEQVFSEMRFSGGDPGPALRVLTPGSRRLLIDALMEVPAEQRKRFAAALEGVRFVELGERGFSEVGERPDPKGASEAETQRLLRMTGVGQAVLARKP